MSTGATRFAISFGALYRPLSNLVLLRPADSYVEVDDETVVARMGWAFSARFPRSSIARVSLLPHTVISRGVHGFGGRWLVNGSGDRVVVIDLAPTARARVVGVPTSLRQLLVSVEEPERLIERLRPAV